MDFDTQQNLPDGLKVFGEVFVSLVNRYPSSAEIELFINSGMNLDDGKCIKSALQNSPERLQINARELWQKCLRAGVKPTFFLHLPRTGGTALVSTLSEIIGLPAMLVQESASGISIREHGNLHWPIKTGHVPIGHIENGIQIISIARDPRTRLLSQFRFFQNMKAKSGEYVEFPRFIEQFGTDLNPLGMGDGPAMFAASRSTTEHKWIDLPKVQRRELLVRGMSRISKMAWNESRSQLEALLRFVVGRDSEMKRHNQSASLGGLVDRPQIVELDNLKKINAIVGIEMEYIRVGIDIGLLDLPDSSKLDELFDEMCDTYKIRFAKSPELQKLTKIESILGKK